MRRARGTRRYQRKSEEYEEEEEEMAKRKREREREEERNVYPANGALIVANCCIVQIGFMNGGRERASRDQPRLEGSKKKMRKKRRRMMMMMLKKTMKKMMTKKEETESPFFSFALSFSLPLPQEETGCSRSCQACRDVLEDELSYLLVLSVYMPHRALSSPATWLTAKLVGPWVPVGTHDRGGGSR